MHFHLGLEQLVLTPTLEQIFLIYCGCKQDWWLTPELYLRRPPAYHPEWRLDRLLKRKAEEGVKVYVIVYKEVGIRSCFSDYVSFCL